MSRVILLKPLGIMRGPADSKNTVYTVTGEDKEGNQFMIGFSTRTCYSSSMEKMLSRLHPVEVPEEKETPIEVTQNDATENSSDR